MRFTVHLWFAIALIIRLYKGNKHKNIDIDWIFENFGREQVKQ